MSDLLDVEFARQKVLSVLSQIKQLQSSDFPYSEPSAALVLLHDLYQKDLDRLNQLDISTSIDVRLEACAHANATITQYYFVLGFALRSTNVRNAFEIYDPLLSQCKLVYGPTAKLIVSSEWMFSPFTYPAVTSDLPDLMFIGLPSSEAGNSLIVPLAGHELGHSVWRKPAPGRISSINDILIELQRTLAKRYQDNWPEFQRIFGTAEPKEKLLNDLFLRGIWTRSYRLAERHVEELFCDLLGLRLFGESFIYSFIYLLAPNFGDRAPHYPLLAARVDALMKGCVKFGIQPPKDFGAYFSDSVKRLPDVDSFILRMADNSSDALIPKIVDAVDDHIRNVGLPLSSDHERDRIVKHFCELSPASKIKSIADVVNAGWHIRLNWSLWDKFDFRPEERLDILNDLVFKTMEVSEFESRMKQ